MTFEIGVGRQKIDDFTPTQTFTAAGMTVAPKLALFRMVAAENNATATANAVYMRGATDGVTDLSMLAYSENGEVSTDGRNAGQVGSPGATDNVNGQCVRLSRPSDGQYQSAGFKAHFDSFGTGSVSLAVDRFATEGDWYLEFVLIGGSDFSCHVSEESFIGSATDEIDITSFGSPADAVILWGIESAIPTINSTIHQWIEGFWSRSAHSTPGGVSVVTSFGNAENPAACRQTVLEGFISGFLRTDSPGGNLDSTFHLQEHASGFTAVLDEDVSSAQGFGVVQMNFGGKRVAYAGILDSPTATGTQAVQSPNLTADLAIVQVTRKDSVNVDDGTESDASILGGGSAIPGTFGYCGINSQEHGQGNPTVTTSYSDDRLIRIPLPDGSFGTGALVASMGSAIARGFNLSWSQVDTGTSRKLALLTIGDSQTLTPDPVTIPLVLPAPTRLSVIAPLPVELPLSPEEPEVLGATTQTPDPVVLALALPTPFTGFLLPDPVVIQLGISDPSIVVPEPPPPPPPDLAEFYRRSMFDLLPLGFAWNRRENSVLGELLFALAREYANVEERGIDVREETDPRTTNELLADWEAFLRIADDCGGLEDSLQERRAAVYAKLTSPGGQNRFHFSELAQALGYAVEIDDIVTFAPFTAGSSAGDPLTNGDWAYVWEVHAPLETARFFRTGTSAVGEPLVTFGNDLLECVFTLNAPAHTLVVFVYDKTPSGYAPWETLIPEPVEIPLALPQPLVT